MKFSILLLERRLYGRLSGKNQKGKASQKSCLPCYSPHITYKKLQDFAMISQKNDTEKKVCVICEACYGRQNESRIICDFRLHFYINSAFCGSITEGQAFSHTNMLKEGEQL